MKNTLNLILFCFCIAFLSCNPGKKFQYALIKTEYGDMKVKLFNSTPKHRDNFMKLAKEGFYNDLLFHRIIKGFMIQGGDPNSKDAAPDARLGSGGPGYLIDAEIGSPHLKGTLAAARTGGASNPEKKSSGSQFYIVQGKPQTDAQLDSQEKFKKITYSPEQRKRYKEEGGTPQLDMDYTVFGQVVEGMDIIDKIAAVQTAPGDRPVQDVKMTVIPE